MWGVDAHPRDRSGRERARNRGLPAGQIDVAPARNNSVPSRLPGTGRINGMDNMKTLLICALGTGMALASPALAPRHRPPLDVRLTARLRNHQLDERDERVLVV